MPPTPHHADEEPVCQVPPAQGHRANKGQSPDYEHFFILCVDVGHWADDLNAQSVVMGS